jgi:fumarylacetoacetate (FAA) hydrolase family protein
MKKLNELLTLECLPPDWRDATLLGRAWLTGEPAGPSPIALRPNGAVVDLAPIEPTMSQLLARPNRVALARTAPGMGFTHKVGDLVSISTPKLGRLVNRVTTSDRAPPWTFGISALMCNLAARGLLGQAA